MKKRIVRTVGTFLASTLLIMNLSYQEDYVNVL